MRNRLKQLREAAEKAVETARTRPAETLKNVTEGMLQRGTASGMPPETALAGSTAAARLWTKVAPKDPLARARLGEALVRDGQYNEAIGELEKIATTRSDVGLLGEAWLARAEIMARALEDSESRVERAAHVLPAPGEPLTAQIRGALGLAALDLYRFDLAERILTSAEDLPIHLLARGRLELARGDLERAREVIGRASRTGLDEAFTWQGMIMAFDGDHKGAWASLKDLRTRGPEGPWTLLGLGWLRLRDGRADAEQYLTRCFNVMPHNAGATYLLGLIAEQNEQHEEAVAWYGKAIEAQPRWTAPRLGLVRAAIASGQWEQVTETPGPGSANKDDLFLSALTLGLAGAVKEAEAAWSELESQSRDRGWRREVSTQRAAVAWKLTIVGRSEAAASVWRGVPRHASAAGAGRITLARWAIDAARRALEASQPAYYAVESALAAASALRPDSEDLVVAHCAATFLSRGPSAAKGTLESAVARGSGDERILGMIALIEAVTHGRPVSTIRLAGSAGAKGAAKAAREGDVEGSLERLEELESGSPPPAVKAVIGGARALIRLAQVPELLRRGQLEEAVEVLGRSLEHLPSGLQRDRVTHDLAAVCTIAARRADLAARAKGDPPPQDAVIWWQEALGYWSAVASSPAYFAELSKRILELDDPRLGPRDADSIRANLDTIVVGLPAGYAREAIDQGHHRRARYFVSLIIGSPLSDVARRAGLEQALEPLTQEAQRLSDAAKEDAVELPPSELLKSYLELVRQVESLAAQMCEAAPEGIGPTSDARDELALGLVAYFENLYDRAGEHRSALEALSRAVELAASETMRAELEGKRNRMEGKQ